MTLLAGVRETAPYATDLYGFADLLDAGDRNRLDVMSSRFVTSLTPLIAENWENATFPAAAVRELAALDIVELAMDPSRSLLHGMVHLELARVDLSMSTFLGVHSLLVAGAVASLGSEEQRRSQLPDLLALRKVGAFALTEAGHGSDISRRMETSATRVGSTWTINGSKRWIGNGTHADVLVVWARDSADHQIKGFLVPRETEGVTTRAINNKIGLRIVQNADIELRDVRVDEEARLSGANSFRDTNQLLTNSRAWVAWQTVGLQYAAYDYALGYALDRKQFGKPIASNQLVQEKLVQILDSAMASTAVMVSVARLQEKGQLLPEHASLAKAGNSARMREAVANARAIFGGNGIVTDFGVARTFADAEAIYSYEGSYEINALVVGRAVTGISAF